MAIRQKHAYRFGYLKSESWKRVRLEALTQDDAVCHICGFRNLHNDLHHVWYPQSFWDTASGHLVTLCRNCHDLIHAVYPEKASDEEAAYKRFRVFRKLIREWLEKMNVQHQIEASHERTLCTCCRKGGLVLSIKPFPVAGSKVPNGAWCTECLTKLGTHLRPDWNTLKAELESHRVGVWFPEI